MTDTMFTRTALTEAAEKAEVTPDQARTILETAGVKVEPEKPALPTEPGAVIIATEVRGEKGEWRAFLTSGRDWVTSERVGGYVWQHRPEDITAWTEAMMVPAGKKIDLADVRVGDLVRVELDSGDEATITVLLAGESQFVSRRNIYLKRHVRAVHLLHREEV